MRLHILHHAGQEPICGVEMIQELQRHGYKLGPGTLYPMLHQLEETGYIVSEEAVFQGKRRRNYRITAQGAKLLSQARTKLRELVDEVIDETGTH